MACRLIYTAVHAVIIAGIGLYVYKNLNIGLRNLIITGIFGLFFVLNAFILHMMMNYLFIIYEINYSFTKENDKNETYIISDE